MTESVLYKYKQQRQDFYRVDSMTLHCKVCSCEIHKILNVELIIHQIGLSLPLCFEHMIRLSQERWAKIDILTTPMGLWPKG